MTGNQIAYWNLQEAKRSNLIKEGETERSNKAKERESRRHNIVSEGNDRTKSISSAVTAGANVIKAASGLGSLIAGLMA